ncbi:MAG TPA: tetratricopeptide repeat protein [Nitrospira sp.]|nr:tetratricopeptide repeat protein [Nitrospira sp.]
MPEKSKIMIRAARRWMLLAIVGILVWPVSGIGQDTLWNTWRQGGLQALHEGRLADAERLLTAALEQAEKYGLDDLRVADAANDLAVVYANSGKPLEAELLFGRALAIGEKGLGPDHPGVGATIQNLGILYATQERYREAEPLLKRSLAINLKEYGGKHVRTALSLKTLSSFYAIQGQMGEAERLIQKSIAILEESRVEKGDPQFVSTLEVLAAILRNTNREREAQEVEGRLKTAQDTTVYR